MKLSYLFFVLLAFVYKPIEAQEKESLKKVNQLVDSCEKLINTGDTATAKVLRDSMLSIVEKMPASVLKGEVYLTSANLAIKAFDFPQAESFYAKTNEIAQNIGGKEGEILKADVLYKKSLMYYQNGDYETTLSLCHNARNIFQKYNNYKKLAEADNRIGGVYQILENQTKASFYNKLAYIESERSGDIKVKCLVLNGHGNYYLANGDTLKAISEYLKSFELAQKNNLPQIMSTSVYNIAFCYSQMGKYDIALHYYIESYSLAKKSGSNYDVADALYKIGLTHGYMSHFSIARDTLSSALKVAERIQSKILLRNIYDVYNCLESECGNYQKAYEYLGKYLDYSESIITEQGQKQVSFLETKFKTAQQQEEISKLNKDNEIKSLKLHSRNLAIIALIALILISGMLFFVIYTNRKRIAQKDIELHKQRINELEKEKQLTATQAILKGETTERARLSKDLHDGLGGMLSAVKLKMLNMKGDFILPAEQVNNFNAALNLLDSSIGELRRVAHNLMPVSLLREGLDAAISDFCFQVDHVKYQFFGQPRRFDEKLEVTAFRIVQESINNALKHSQATEIYVQLILDESRLSICIQDNGKGFNLEEVTGRKTNGLTNMQSRVDALKGNLSIHSEIGKGTEIFVEFNV